MRATQLCIALALLGVGLIGRAGDIQYEIFSIDDAGKLTLIGAGVKAYADTYFQVELRGTDKEAHWSKELELEKGFRIGLSSYREPVVEGFGLWAKRAPCGFSWEWFDALDATRFEKRQESGRLSVSYANYGVDREISEIHFESDVSLRLNESPNPDKDTHRVLIKTGSVLKLPHPAPHPKAPEKTGFIACSNG